ncbi:unnamed protein product [Linum tenue]|uniref:F-box domain-containing protein n=1 Tax=Linum tenue TaxID=586396 RepID=A0AAV0JV47_9ROSI|nr:unnamed protein product [Linum tenue]
MEYSDDEEDRLSYLPDNVRDHILYFLDTKHCVQTSVLSTKWRSLWKHVTHLQFDADSFPTYPDFTTFLKQALDTFGDGTDSPRVAKLTYKDRELWRLDHLRQLDLVMQYVDSRRHIRHICVHGGGSEEEEEMLRFSSLVAAFLDSDLGTLELGLVRFRSGNDWRGFRILENLVLEGCSFDWEWHDEGFDFFDDKFPCLKNLVLSGCDLVRSGRRTWFRVSGPQLVNLEISGTLNLAGVTVEIDAPNLESFSLVLLSNVPKFSQVSLPSLDRAYVGSRFAPHSGEETRTTVAANLVDLFRGLHNVRSLRLDYHITEV